MLKYKKIKKNDIVKVIAGKNKPKDGRVLEIDREKGRVLVEGVNLVKKTMRKTNENPNGGIKEVEAFLNISNVQLLCPKCKKGVRVSIKVTGDKKIRVCKKCDTEIE